MKREVNETHDTEVKVTHEISHTGDRDRSMSHLIQMLKLHMGSMSQR